MCCVGFLFCEVSREPSPFSNMLTLLLASLSLERFPHSGHPRQALPFGPPPARGGGTSHDDSVPYAPLLPPANEINLHFLAHATTPEQAAQHAARALSYQQRTYLPSPADGSVRHRPHSGGHVRPMYPGGGLISWGTSWATWRIVSRAASQHGSEDRAEDTLYVTKDQPRVVAQCVDA